VGGSLDDQGAGDRHECGRAVEPGCGAIRSRAPRTSNVGVNSSPVWV
jgi:hypothetical protein